MAQARLEKILLAGFAGVMLHLALDSLTGSVFWLWPFSDRSLTLVQVPALYKPWQLNFILHWTLYAEIAIIIAAAIVFLCNRQAEKYNAAE